MSHIKDNDTISLTSTPTEPLTEIESSHDDDDSDYVAQSSHYLDFNATSDDEPPTINNRYQVLDEIGKGRFSRVHRAVDIQNSSSVALKIYRASSEYYEAFINEVKLYKRLEGKSHENVVSALDHFVIETERGSHGVVVFPLMQSDLKRLLDDMKCLPIDTVHRVILQVLDGLQFLHSCGIIHADIKPENLLIDDDMNIKICDIGSGMVSDEIDSFHVGTIPYIAPELLLGVEYTCKIDVWSVGCLYFELLTGDCLFDPEIYFKEDTDRDSQESSRSSGSRSSGSSSVQENDRKKIKHLENENPDGDGHKSQGTYQSDEDKALSADIPAADKKQKNKAEGMSVYSDEDDDVGYEWEVSHFQLAAFKNILGRIPYEKFHNGKYYSSFFGPGGRLKSIPRYMDDRNINAIMTQDFDIEDNIAMSVEEDLLKILKYDPDERPSVMDVGNLIKSKYDYS